MGKILGDVRSSKYLIPFTKDDLGIGKVVSFLYSCLFKDSIEYRASVIESGEKAMVARIMEVDPQTRFSGSSGNRKRFRHSRMFVYSIKDPFPDEIPASGSDKPFTGAHGEEIGSSGENVTDRVESGFQPGYRDEHGMER
jgi:hypothetical protein